MHKDVQALLKSKNRCLSQLISVTEDALTTTMGNLGSKALLDPEYSDNLPVFDQSRAAIFNTIELVDREINQQIAKIAPHTQPTSREREELRALVNEQKSLIESLQALDSRLLEILDNAIRSGQREVSQQIQQREKLNRFKSQATPETGEELDQKL